MGSADGSILGLNSIHTSGAPSACWNLVIVADGYRSSRMAQFARDAQSVADILLQTAPFDRTEITNVINIFRLDVASMDAGADKPHCGPGIGSSTYVRTYFDSRFCWDGATQRLLYGNVNLVQDTVKAALPEYHQILVLVDDSERGGGGGSVGWFSNGGSDWREVAIHELGHSAFGLADEYDYGEHNHWPGGEPAEPNVSAISDSAAVKWHARVDTAAANPTRANPNCSTTDPGPSPEPGARIGTFEGAKYSHCGAYRPAWNCMMRQTGAPFCGVCEDVIVSAFKSLTHPVP